MGFHQSWHRSRNNRIFTGVCGGLAEMWGMDPSLIRLMWVLFTLWTHATGILLYLVATLLLPAGESEERGEGSDFAGQSRGRTWVEVSAENRPFGRRAQQWMGLLLIVAGGYWLAERFVPQIIGEVRRVALPLILIVLGLWLVFKEKRGEGD
jgi:phage shock protein C